MTLGVTARAEEEHRLRMPECSSGWRGRKPFSKQALEDHEVSRDEQKWTFAPGLRRGLFETAKSVAAGHTNQC